MKFLATASKLAFVGTPTASAWSSMSSSRIVVARSRSTTTILPVTAATTAAESRFPFAVAASPSQRPFSRSLPATTTTTSTRLFSSRSAQGGDAVQLQNIGREEMEEILEDYEEGGREESGYVVFDVREPNEVAMTGSLSPHTINLPLQLLARQNVFALDDDDFEDVCGFSKPTPDETLVFSCASGIRSVHAAQFAAMNGYTKLVNYKGGAHEWFS